MRWNVGENSMSDQDRQLISRNFFTDVHIRVIRAIRGEILRLEPVLDPIEITGELTGAQVGYFVLRRAVFAIRVEQEPVLTG